MGLEERRVKNGELKKIEQKIGVAFFFDEDKSSLRGPHLLN